MRSDATLPTIFILSVIVLALIYGEIVIKVIILIPFIIVLLGLIVAPIIKALEYLRAAKK